MKIKLKNIIIGSVVLSLFLFLIPQDAHGFILDKFKLAAENLGEKTGPVASTFVLAFFFFYFGYILLFFSTFLLEGIIANTPYALNVVAGTTAGNIVRVGWNYTAGIVNLILIIAFVVIAFAVIIGSEKIQLKKALPNLILVALLVNFTILFVGMGIDISNFLFNSIANQFFPDGNGLLYRSVTNLFEISGLQSLTAFAYFTSVAYALTLPVVNVGVQVAWLVGLPFILPVIINYLVYGSIMYALSSLFFLYFIVFLIRIFIIQILTILAPLAFFCLIFNQTQKYWKQWLDALVQWLFVGVIFIFLMYFGLIIAPLIVPLVRGFNVAPGILGSFLGVIFNIAGNIALLAYFLVIVSIIRSFAPAAASAVISQVSSFAKNAAPWAGAIAKGTGRGIRNWEAKRTTKNETAAQPTTRLERAQRWVSNTATKAIRRGHNIAGTSIEVETQKDIKKERDKIQGMFGDGGQEAAIEAYNATPSMAKTETHKMAFLQYISEGGAKALNKLTSEQQIELFNLANERGESKTVRNAVRHIPTSADVAIKEKELAKAIEKKEEEGGEERVKNAENNLTIAKKIQSIMMSDIRKDDEVKRIQEELDELMKKIPPDSVSIKEKQEEFTRACSAAIYKISVQSLKTSDVENLSNETLMNDNFIKAMVKYRSPDFVRSVGKRPDAVGAIKKIDEVMSNIPLEELETVNPSFYSNIEKTSGGQGLYPKTHKRIQEKKEQKRREIEKEREKTEKESERKKKEEDATIKEEEERQERIKRIMDNYSKH